MKKSISSITQAGGPNHEADYLVIRHMRVILTFLRARIRSGRLLLARGQLGSKHRYDLARVLYHRAPLPNRIKRLLRSIYKSAHPERPASDYDSWISQYDTLHTADRVAIKKHIASFDKLPTFSVVMPTYNTPKKFLRETIESVRNQLYPYWELCVADDASTLTHVRKILERYSRLDSRIKIVFREHNGHISAASNSALELATGDYVALLDHDDVLSEHALYMVAECINRYNGQVDVIYTDEDKLDRDGRRYDPYFKACWNRYFIHSQNYVAHLGVYRKTAVDKVGGFRVGYEGSQDYDLLLRIIENTSDDKIKHVPFVLYHWRNFSGNVTFSSTQHHISDRSACKALTEHFGRLGEKIVFSESRTVKGCWDQDFILETEPSVSIIIPTKDNVDILNDCIESIISGTDYSGILEVIIVDNNSKRPETFNYLQELVRKSLPFSTKVIYDKGEFNYSRLNNLAVKEAGGEVIVFLNNDVKAIDRLWLKRMVAIAVREDVGVVGAKLLYGNNTVQHAGVVLGIYGIASHPFRGIPADKNVYFGYPNLLREVSAVTAACMVIRKSIFFEAGGFDESLFPISFNDVDLSLKIQSLGYKNIYTPMARLYHFESKSRGADDTVDKLMKHRRASRNMILKYSASLTKDRFYSPNLSLGNENYELSDPPRIGKPWRNWVEFVVPFHRGDVLLAVQVAENARMDGVRVRLHVASELKSMVTNFNPSFEVESLSINLPTAAQTPAYYEIAKKLVTSRSDFSGKLASIHGAIDFRTNGLDIVEKMLHELEMPIDRLLDNKKPTTTSRKYPAINKRTILLHPFGGWELKSMPSHFIVKLVNLANKAGYQVVQIGGQNDAVCPVCDGAILKNHTMHDWALIFQSAAAAFCVDSWVSHFSAIMDVNHIVFYGSTRSIYTNSRRHFAQKESAFLIVDSLVKCSPCDNFVCKEYQKTYCHSFDMINLDKISAFLRDLRDKQAGVHG